MFDAISKLVESGVIGEETQKTIQEAGENKVKENKEKRRKEESRVKHEKKEKRRKKGENGEKWRK